MGKIIVTIPVHNEAKFIEQAIKTIYPMVSSYESLIVIVEDGSTDGSDHICRFLASTYPNILYLHSKHKLGRGRALKNAWSQIKGDIYIYLDADLATNMQAFHRLIMAVQNGFDLVTGSRYIPGAKVYRPPLRNLISLIYNFVVRFMFKTKVYDHQCGFKAFSARLINSILPQCRSDHWFLDTEIIVLATLYGFKIHEFPVVWVEKRYKNTPIKRLVKDIFNHGLGLLKLWLRIKGSYILTRTFQQTVRKDGK